MYDVGLDSGRNQVDGMRASLMYETSSMSEPKQKLARTSIA